MTPPDKAGFDPRVQSQSPALEVHALPLSHGGIFLNSFLTITGKFSVTTATLLYVFGPCERHSELTEEM